jgi:hypothetical protein
MPARDLDRRLGSPSRLGELASEVVQDRGPGQSEGEAVDVRKTLGDGKAALDPLPGAIGKAKEPKRLCRIQPARHGGALRVEQEVGTMLFPGRDRIVDRDALVQRRHRIGEPAEEEQRRALSAPGQGAAERCSLLVRQQDQPLREIVRPLVLTAYQVAIPQPP